MKSLSVELYKTKVKYAHCSASVSWLCWLLHQSEEHSIFSRYVSRPALFLHLGIKGILELLIRRCVPDGKWCITCIYPSALSYLDLESILTTVDYLIRIFRWNDRLKMIMLCWSEHQHVCLATVCVFSLTSCMYCILQACVSASECIRERER